MNPTISAASSLGWVTARPWGAPSITRSSEPATRSWVRSLVISNGSTLTVNNGYAINGRGRIAAEIVDAYRAAH